MGTSDGRSNSDIKLADHSLLSRLKNYHRDQARKWQLERDDQIAKILSHNLSINNYKTGDEWDIYRVTRALSDSKSFIDRFFEYDQNVKKYEQLITSIEFIERKHSEYINHLKKMGLKKKEIKEHAAAAKKAHLELQKMMPDFKAYERWENELK